ncbi:hypothetical protein DH2020_039240 [Rehmannia glutinosa]|uniref:IBH1-like N-terminal domain-containing protein n=1 Tax=Rehmannia glutinosa TaxID=99300 RepID=A0ABR0UWD3_REHGL
MKARMQNSSSSALLKQEFLKKWINGLQTYTNTKKEMTILDRKNAIKLSADIAIASTRNFSTNWSRAVMADVSKNVDGSSKIVTEKILGRKETCIIKCSKNIMRKSRLLAHRKRAIRRTIGRTSVKAASAIAKELVKKRTRVLKRLVPGGKQMNEICLIKETLDYIASLQVQVDVMRNIANAADQCLDSTERSLL